MKKRMNKKGFTIVELVIVIAVIAILASVMIPTFTGIVEKAQESAARQEVVNAYKEAYGLALADTGRIEEGEEEVVSGFTFKFNADGAGCVVVKAPTDFNYIATYTASTNTWTLEENP